MAGRGKRMRPHTLTIPKPLIRIAGKPIVQRLVEEIASVVTEEIEEIAFVIGDFGRDVENELIRIAENAGAKGRIYYQREALGTAHAIYCAEPSLSGKMIVAYADTLFKANFELDETKDGTIWVHRVDNPSDFGVVLVNQGLVSAFYEKPETFITDLAIIGIYYFRDGNILKDQIKRLLTNDIKTGGEFGITDALQNMMENGMQFSVNQVDEWLDCGNKNATVHTNQRILEIYKGKAEIPGSAVIHNSIVKQPCFIGEKVRITDSIVGPYVSVGEESQIEKCVINNTIIQTNTKLINRIVNNSMIGNYAEITGKSNDISVGDYTVFNE